MGNPPPLLAEILWIDDPNTQYLREMSCLTLQREVRLRGKYGSSLYVRGGHVFPHRAWLPRISLPSRVASANASNSLSVLCLKQNVRKAPVKQVMLFCGESNFPLSVSELPTNP